MSKDTSKSNLNDLAWKRFKKNIPAMAGLFVIVLLTFISVFAYQFSLDSTPNVNRQILEISMMPPGSSIQFIKTKKTEFAVPAFSLSQVFNGKEQAFNLIPIRSYELKDHQIFYIPFDKDPLALREKKAVSSEQLFGNQADTYLCTQTFWLGTDKFGRDILSRLLVGSRVSLSVGLISVIISLIIGLSMGAIAGYFGGKTDQIILWLINVVWSIPTLLLIIAITMAIGKGFVQIFIAVGLTMWVEVARVVRGQVLSLKQKEFIEACKALGFSHTRIIVKHIVPNVMSPVIVISAANFASAILMEAGLSFLGIGVQPPMPSWGSMIKENYGYIVYEGAAYMALIPGFAILILVLSFILFGNGLRDAFDSKNEL
jgi:peptide/nickel transport system permease protein